MEYLPLDLFVAVAAIARPSKPKRIGELLEAERMDLAALEADLQIW